MFEVKVERNRAREPDAMNNDYFPTIESIHSETAPDTDILKNRKQTLEVKLAVLAKNLQTRMNLYQRTTSSLESTILEALQSVDHFTENKHYGLPYPKEEFQIARRELQTVNQELRSRDSECWRDVSMIMRDILATWEELQTATAKEALMNHDE